MKNWDEKKVTGILLCDLSAAYDTLSPNILCEKLIVYGSDRLMSVVRLIPDGKKIELEVW